MYCHILRVRAIPTLESTDSMMVYGVNRNSMLCELPQFDVTTQRPQDLMHLLFEGVFPLHMGLLLDHVHSLGVISLEQLNGRVSSHPYGYFEEKPVTISTFELTGTQTGIKFLVKTSLYKALTTLVH